MFSNIRCLEMFFKKFVLKIFVKFLEKHLCESLFFIKVAGWGWKVLKEPVTFTVNGLSKIQISFLTLQRILVLFRFIAFLLARENEGKNEVYIFYGKFALSDLFIWYLILLLQPWKKAAQLAIFALQETFLQHTDAFWNTLISLDIQYLRLISRRK